MTFWDNTETDVEIILATYQTRRKEVLYAELLLAATAQAQGQTGTGGGSLNTTAVGGGLNDGGIGGGDIEIIGGCFATATLIPTPRGLFNFREIYERFTRGRREVYSFDKEGNVETDYVTNIWHGIKPCVEMVFDGVSVKATPQHLIYPAFGEKKAVREFAPGDTNMFFIGGKWQDLALQDVIECEPQEVWNMAIKKNKCYLPANMAASNRKYEGQTQV